MYNNELYHYGIKGQKWGVRRYQNEDGTLTAAGRKRLAKDLRKDFKRNYRSEQPYRTSKNYDRKVRESVSKVITKDDKKRILSARSEYLEAINKSFEAEDALRKIADKYGYEYYESERDRNPNLTEREKQKLYEYAAYEYGYDKAREARPDLAEVEKASDSYWNAYIEECRKVSDKLLGEYGNTKLYSDKYGQSLSIRDTVGSVVSSMDNDWKL